MQLICQHHHLFLVLEEYIHGYEMYDFWSTKYERTILLFQLKDSQWIFFSYIPNDHRDNTFLHIVSQEKYHRSPNSLMLKASCISSTQDLSNI